MLSFLEEHDIFPSLHIGGLPGMSTSDAVEMIHDKLLNSRSQNIPSCFVSIDQTQAFTMIQHSILMKKLDHIGFSYQALAIMKQYLMERKQKTYFNGSYSDIATIGGYGCFQGLVTSSLLYVLYVLDQPSIAHIKCTHDNNYTDNDSCDRNLSINYIDDNMSEITPDKWENIEYNVETFLKNQQDYHQNNLLAFNHEKTIFMVNSRSKKYRNKFITFNNKKIEHSDKIKILGTVYNENLNFNNHIDKGMKKKKSLIIRLKQKLNLIKKIKYWLNVEDLKIIANLYINGVLQYGILLWAKSNSKMIEKIEKLRVKVIRTIIGYNETNDMNREQIFKLFNWSTIEDSRIIAENIRIHKIINQRKPHAKYIDLMRNRTPEQVKYKYINTRLRSQESFNKIPLNIRNKNIKNFKKAYKIYRQGLKYKPIIVKNKASSSYTLIWPRT